MERVEFTISGTAEEVADALRLLGALVTKGQAKTVPEKAAPSLVPVADARPSLPEALPTLAGVKEQKKRAYRLRKYSDVICARPGCGNKLTIEQAERGGKFCSLSCSGKFNGAINGAKTRGTNYITDPVTHRKERVTIVAGEGVLSGSLQ